MDKQTAVEWLVQEVNKINVSTEARLFINKLKEQAKAMEKEQIIEFTNDYVLTQCNASFEGNVVAELSAEEYYELTFKSE